MARDARDSEPFQLLDLLAEALEGWSLHDLCHAGQVQVLKRLRPRG